MSPLTLTMASFAVLPNVFSYVGPGLSPGAIVVSLGILATIVLAVFAIAWYPLRRLYRAFFGGAGKQT